MNKRVKIETTKRGLPAMWECGGGLSNTGGATIIAGKHGEKLTPIYIRRSGHLACENHALFVIDVGDIVVEAYQHRGDFDISVYKIIEIVTVDDKRYAILELINEFSQGEWDNEPTGNVMDAVDASIKKAKCYHCRETHYAKFPEQ
jgi:hypothetical protein